MQGLYHQQYLLRQSMTANQLLNAFLGNKRALKIRIGVGGPVYYNFNREEPPKTLF